MKKSSSLIILCLLILLTACGCADNRGTEDGNADISISKVDHSAFSDDRQITGNFFYEKPIIPNGYDAAEKINAYFEDDCDNFFNGFAVFFGDNAFQRMKDCLDEGLTRYGDEGIVKQPFCYYVKTEITFLSEDHVSFCQTYVWAADGPRDVWNRGVTFDLKTGETVPFTEFFDVDTDTVKEYVHGELSDLFGDMPFAQQELAEMYESSGEMLEKSYFYDGQTVNLTLDYAFYPHNGVIFSWSGAEPLRKEVYIYLLNAEGKLERQLL